MNWKKFPEEIPYPNNKIILKQFLCHHDVDVSNKVLYWCEIDTPTDIINK